MLMEFQAKRRPIILRNRRLLWPAVLGLDLPRGRRDLAQPFFIPRQNTTVKGGVKGKLIDRGRVGSACARNVNFEQCIRDNNPLFDDDDDWRRTGIMG